MANPWEMDWSAPATPPAANLPWEMDWSKPEGAQTSVVEQAGTGTIEGIANLLGMPVDWVQRRWNANAAALRERGVEGAKDMAAPFGGSESIKAAAAPLMTDVEPQTAAQRVARRVGQDVGAGATAAPLVGISSLGGMALNALSDLGSGIAGGLTSEVTDDPTINALASLVGGSAVVAGSYARRDGPQAPSNDALRAREDALWQRVRDSNVRLTPRAAQELKGNVSARAYDMRMKPSLHGPEATASVDEVWELPARPSLWEIEEARRFIGDSTPAAYDRKATARVTTGLKDEVDAYLRGISHPDAAIATEARDVSRRRIASEKLDRTLDRAERQAARANNGANVVNSQRQRIDAVLNSPKDRASFRPGEVAQMESIVRGTPGANAARFVGSISPTRGGAFAVANGLGFGAGVSTGDPMIMGLAAMPGTIGFVARQIGEKLTDAQIKRLSATIRNGGIPLAGKALSKNEEAVLAALLGARAANEAEQ